MKIVVTGARGQVGSEIIKLFALTEHEMVPFTRQELDCVDLKAVHSVLSAAKPDLIINAAAYTAVDKAEDEPQLAQAINADFVQRLAEFCDQNKIPLIHFSTDYVFDGTKKDAYSETDQPNPQGVYAKSKLDGEQAIRSQLHNHIILRVSWVFGVYGSNFVKTILNLASSREEIKIVADQWGRPTAAKDIARVLLEIVNKISSGAFDNWGTYHYAGEAVTNWYEFSRVFIHLAKKNKLHLALSNLIPITSQEFPTKAKRPKNSILDTSKIEHTLGILCHRWVDYLPEVIQNYIENMDMEV